MRARVTLFYYDIPNYDVVASAEIASSALAATSADLETSADLGTSTAVVEELPLGRCKINILFHISWLYRSSYRPSK
jgi:hypothetical protein